MTLLHRSRVALYVIICSLPIAVIIIMLASSFMGFGWVVGSLVLVRNLPFCLISRWGCVIVDALFVARHL